MPEIWDGIFACATCREPLEQPKSGQAERVFFYHENITCSKCKSPVDWWKEVFVAVRENHMRWFAFKALGAETKFAVVPASPGDIVEFNHVAAGMPAGSLILNRTITCKGYICAYDRSINDTTPKSLNVSLYIGCFGQRAPDNDSEVVIAITYIEPGHDGVPWQSLIEAFESYTQNDYVRMLVSANVAVEAMLSPFIASVLDKVTSLQNAKQFLDNAATYSHQLNVLLPLILFRTSLPRMTDALRGRLNRLRDLRNQVAHNGATKKPLLPHEAAEMVCAGLFGFQYLKILAAKYKERGADSAT